ncbi:EamA family transporter RarD [Deltaproteobacteria bacterium IMCC39524]|nr:EamA family transporter RarD [Deltaproteobacteria bacterium IMCC39524]
MKATEPLAGNNQATTSEADHNSRIGVLLGLTAYLIWGSFPVFFKALEGAAPLEIVCHRIFWSVVFLFILVTCRRQLGQVGTTIKNRRVLLTLCGSTLLIATNWLVFIYAVQHGEVLQSSLGYFITPLLSILLGFIFLRERLNRWQQFSVLLALIGVLNLTLHHGQVPWIALILASSFGLYGLLRKVAQVEAMIGLTVETLLLGPFALTYIIYLTTQQDSSFLTGTLRLDLLLPLSGIVTAIPLLLFVAAARRLQLATIGFLQYLTPSLHFLLAVGLYNEPFSRGHLVSFLFIWMGLAIYSGNTIWKSRSAWQREES